VEIGFSVPQRPFSKGAQNGALGSLSSFWRRGLSNDSSYRLKPPFTSPARAVPVVVKRRRNPAKGVALTAQIPDLRESGLLSRVWFQVALVGGQPVAELDITNAFAVRAFVS
jgi:hypothetical protein